MHIQTVRNLNNFKTVTHKYSVNSHESYSHEYPKVQNLEEEISLMSLEKDLKTLEEQNNAKRRKKKFSEHLTKFFKSRRPNTYRK